MRMLKVPDRWTQVFCYHLDAFARGKAGLQDKKQSKCRPGVCFKPDMCMETAEGVECAPCPEGYTGDGVRCDDVDEVRLNMLIFCSS